MSSSESMTEIHELSLLLRSAVLRADAARDRPPGSGGGSGDSSMGLPAAAAVMRIDMLCRLHDHRASFLLSAMM